jgi:ribosomal protein S3AE
MAIKKKFIKVEIPILDETIMALGTSETLNNKTIKLDLSRKLRGRNLELTLSLRVTEEKIKGYPKRLRLMKQYISRMMRKRINYVEESFEAQCQDILCTIKPFLITRKKVSRAIRHNLRKTAKEFLIEYVKEKNYLEVCESVLYAEVQKEMLSKLKKIYPLSFCEIRVLETNKLDGADLSQNIKKDKRGIEEESPIKEDKKEIEENANFEEELKEKEVEEEKPKKIIKKITSKKE